jgi:hypothetical protein
MAKQRLFPEPPKDEQHDPKKRFSDLATKIFTVPKSEIDEREKQWRDRKKSRTK